MVTEKDLYQNIRIDCNVKYTKKESDDYYLYDMKNEVMILESTKQQYYGYPITRVLETLNKGIWKIVSIKSKIYELW
jgi:hypothetical protein